MAAHPILSAKEIKQKCGVDTLVVTREVESDLYFGVEYVAGHHHGLIFWRMELERSLGLEGWDMTSRMKSKSQELVEGYKGFEFTSP